MNDDSDDLPFASAGTAKGKSLSVEGEAAEQQISAGSFSGTCWCGRQLLGRDVLVLRLWLLVFSRGFSVRLEEVILAAIREGKVDSEEVKQVAPPLPPRGRLLLVCSVDVPIVVCWFWFDFDKNSSQ